MCPTLTLHVCARHCSRGLGACHSCTVVWIRDWSFLDLHEVFWDREELWMTHVKPDKLVSYRFDYHKPTQFSLAIVKLGWDFWSDLIHTVHLAEHLILPPIHPSKASLILYVLLRDCDFQRYREHWRSHWGSHTGLKSQAASKGQTCSSTNRSYHSSGFCLFGWVRSQSFSMQLD